MAYSEKVIDHFENPRNVGTLDKDDPNVGTGLVGAPACLHGDTLVAVADGRKQVSIRKLAEEGVDVPVFSYREGVGVVIQNATCVRKTQEGAPVVKVTFTNGSHVVCTADHLFRTRARYLEPNLWVEAGKLHHGQSMMPFVRVVRQGYYHIHTNFGRRVPEHQMVWMHHHKSGIPAGHQVHHVNHKKVNNNPHNLQLLTVEEHSKHHTEERLKGGWVPSGRDISGAKNPMIEWWGRATEEEKALYRKRMSRSTSLEKNGRWVDVGNDVLLRVGYEIYQERGKLTAVIWQKYAKEKGFPQNLSARFGLFTHFREACISFNHKVSSVEPFGTTDVYCMTVDGDANFAVVTKTSDRKHSGVIVHNCGDVLRLQLKINPETEIIEDAKAKTFGCGSAIASSSLVTEWVRGRTLSEAMLIKNTHIADELTLPPVKLHCSVLAEDAIKSAIADFRKKQEAKRAVK